MEKLKVGDFIRVKTAVGRGGVDEESFGTVVYEVVEVGLPYKPNPKWEGVKCQMVAGNGPRVVAGRTVIDSQESIVANIKAKKTEIISLEEAKQLSKKFAAVLAANKNVSVGGMKGKALPGGGIEIE